MTANLSIAAVNGAAPPRARVVGVSGVCKTYRTKRGTVTALSDLSFDIADGEFVTVVGPSGCGKSTILKIIAGLMPPTTGTVEVFGDTVTEPRADAGMVFQSPRLLKWRTVLDNVLLPIEILGLPRAKHVPAAMELLELAGVHEFAGMRPGELSGGMQQRVAICRALVHDPRLLLMDEPFGALDALSRDVMNVELMRIWNERRKTTVLITHSIQEAIFLADRVLVMGGRPGTVVAEVPVDLPRPRHPSIRSTPAFQRLSIDIHRLLGVEYA
ncbi:ABC transporter ATP-binding protein [Pigmentiphaga soli]